MTAIAVESGVADARPARLPVPWTRIALGALLLLTAVLYLAGLSRSGWANDFYAAAVQAGTRSWKAFFFGSFDSSSFITVDKTPASLWVMELSGRIFGFSSWSMLAPQALEGVASVGLLYGAVRRWAGPVAGLLAGLVLAVTPVAVLMFRFNNPDSLLVLLLVAAAYALVRAIENGRTRWLVLCGVLLGFAFLAKMLQAFLVLPGFAVAYLWAGPPRLLRRVWQLFVSGAGVLAGAGWWVLAVSLTPGASRPYVGGSTDNSILQLAIGYNGFGRLSGNETGSVGGRGGFGGGGGLGAGGAGGGGAGGGGGWGGAASVLRLFRSEFGGQISWLLPAAVIALVALLWVSRRGPRTDRTRAAALIWGSWVLVTGLVFSYMNGIIHPYYMVALAPGIAALVGIGSVVLWRSVWGRRVLAAAVVVTGWWAFTLLGRTPSWLPWLRWTVLVAAVGGALAVLGVSWVLSRRGLAGVAVGVPVALCMFAGLAGPVAYAVDTASSSHAGALPSAGPAGGGGFGGPGGAGGRGGGGGGLGGRGGFRSAGGAGAAGSAGFPGAGTGAAGFPGAGTGAAGNAQAGGALPAGNAAGRGNAAGTFPGGAAGLPGGAAGLPGGGGGGGGGGGLGGNTQVSSALKALLEKDASRYTWVAATEGSQEAAPLELATGDAVMAIGGFNGTDPWPTLTWFKDAVAKGEVHYFIGRNSQSFGGGSGSSALTAWVAAHFTSQTVGGVTVYDLTKPA